MGSHGGERSVFDHGDAVAAGYHVEPVGDDQHRLALAQAGDRLVDEGLVLRVGRARGLVQHEDGRVLEDGAGDGDALTLAA